MSLLAKREFGVSPDEYRASCGAAGLSTLS